MWKDRIKLLLRDRGLRNKMLAVLGVLALFRLGANIPIPGVNQEQLAAFLSGNQFFGLLNVFSGGGLSSLSIMMLGVAPYITATIIMQLCTMIFPRLKELYHEEGETGRRKFNQYSRMLTVPLALVQAFGLLTLLGRAGIIANLSFGEQIINLVIVVAGSMVLMWVGEKITEFGIGNGVSLLIFAGILAGIPTSVEQLAFTYEPAQIPLFLAFAIGAILIVAGVVMITEAERPIPISYAKRVRGVRMYGGMSTHLPLRVNQAGVMPIIFALSILLFPQLVASVIPAGTGGILGTIAGLLTAFVSNIFLYGIFYFVLVFLFSYFYTAVTFDPEAIATNLQKSGAFIPGIRPGNSTMHYIGRVLNRITFVGATFLGAIAVLPLVMQRITGLTALAIGGTALLIVVSVVLETVKTVESQLVTREYE